MNQLLLQLDMNRTKPCLASRRNTVCKAFRLVTFFTGLLVRSEDLLSVEILFSRCCTLKDLFSNIDVAMINAHQTFSFFYKPIRNIKPFKNITIYDAYRYVISDYAKERTLQLRQLEDVEAIRSYKSKNFDYCTFSGVFEQRNSKNLKEYSGFICVDLDHVQDLDKTKQLLLDDKEIVTALLFVSPSGKGLKWIVLTPLDRGSHGYCFNAIAKYLHTTYGIQMDLSGRDTARACFLSYDPEAFINPKFIIKDHESERRNNVRC